MAGSVNSGTLLGELRQAGTPVGTLRNNTQTLTGRMVSTGKLLSGMVTTRGTLLSGVVVTDGTLAGTVVNGIKKLNGSVRMPVSFEAYAGGYVVTPRVEEQVLATHNKRMVDDVTVEAIPYWEVDNTSDGQTVIIGG